MAAHRVFVLHCVCLYPDEVINISITGGVGVPHYNLCDATPPLPLPAQP